MPRLALFAFLAAGTLAGCTFDGRTDGGSPRHTDNGALAAHRDAVESEGDALPVEPLSGAVTPSTAPVPTPRMGTVAQEAGTAAPARTATPPAATQETAPAVPAPAQ